MEWKKRRYVTVRKTFLVLLFLSIFSLGLVYGAEFTEDKDLYFTGTQNDPGTLYQDGMDGNQDVGIQICDVGSRYVGAFYALYDGSWNYIPITYKSDTEALAQTTESSGNCWYTLPGFLWVSPSTLSSPNPDIYKAAFPGKLFIGYASSANPGTISNFIFADTDAQLLGDYQVTRRFDQTDQNIDIQTPTITFQTQSNSFSYAADNSNYGISSDRRMVIGCCEDQDGEDCNDGRVFSGPSFPAEFSTGLSSAEVNDQNTYTRYIVMNGIGKEMCIGANLEATLNSIIPQTVYYSMDLTITSTYTNPRDTPYERYGGNVDVTSPFDIRIRIYNSSDSSDVIYNKVFTVDSGLSVDGSLGDTTVWAAYEHSGIYTVEITVDVNDDIAECNEGDNVATGEFELKPITLPEIWIDGNETDIFPYPNIPYNLKFHFKNSDNDTLRNATVNIFEENGLNIMAPPQVYNKSLDEENQTSDALAVQNKVTFSTDYDGNMTLVFIPTYNKLYLPEYSYLGYENITGSHTLYFKGTQENGEQFVFVENRTIISYQYNMSIENYTFRGHVPDKEFENEAIVGQVLDYVYHTFTNFLEAVLDEI